jgi:hypothetical protein
VGGDWLSVSDADWGVLSEGQQNMITSGCTEGLWYLDIFGGDVVVVEDV